MIVGIGIDVCSLERLAAAGERPGFLARVFNPEEIGLSELSRAGRFAAKEALAKALGAPAGLRWLDCTITNDPDGRPLVHFDGTVKRRAEELGVRTIHLSISHDAGVAVAVAVLEA